MNKSHISLAVVLLLCIVSLRSMEKSPSTKRFISNDTILSEGAKKRKFLKAVVLNGMPCSNGEVRMTQEDWEPGKQEDTNAAKIFIALSKNAS